MIGPKPLCGSCVYLTKGGKCKAFPKGIPEEIQWDGYDHRKPFKGDNGIRYKKRKL